MTSVTTRPPCGSTDTLTPADRTPRDAIARYRALTAAIGEPWVLRVRSTALVVRPAGAADLHRVGALHARCSPRTLLDRYRAGGKRPSPIALEGMVRRPLAFAVALPTGALVGLATVGADVLHGGSAGELGVLIADDWQGMGIGRELIAHAAAAATVCGYTELMSYPGTTLAVADQLLSEIGSTRFASDDRGLHLHTYLPETAALGLGSVRAQLAS